MGKYDIVEVERNVSLLIAQIRDVIVRSIREELRPLDISPIQLAALIFIDSVGGETTPGKLAAFMAHKPHSVSELLTRMEKAGLVNKQRDQVKESRVIITMTEKGHRILSQENVKSAQEIMSCLSEEELNQLSLLLKKLRDKASKINPW